MKTQIIMTVSKQLDKSAATNPMQLIYAIPTHYD